MRDFLWFQQSPLKLNYDFKELPMATHHEQPEVYAKRISPPANRELHNSVWLQ